MAVARYLVQGVDVWLNTPLRPQEASGTSGMKAAANGALNLSTLDGWWDEAWRVPDRGPRASAGPSARARPTTIPNTRTRWRPRRCTICWSATWSRPSTIAAPDRLPRRWIDRMKASIGDSVPLLQHPPHGEGLHAAFYLPAHAQYRRWRPTAPPAPRRWRPGWPGSGRWPHVRVEAVDDGPRPGCRSAPIGARARMQLGPLTPDDVVVEFTWAG